MPPLRFNAFLLLSLLLFMPFSYGMVNGGMQAKYQSLHQLMKGVNEKIQMTSSRKLLMGAMLDYEETGANTKHEPRKRPGKP
ncbi:hypothetical protein ERO13_A03G051600v2 [Gossypium hirsutum]|uniref:Uncharacterized protein n=4 Tax=Gossypium TaxID=3633 RepID=A0A5J5WBV5_GOSBA|nr:hypothetical protein ES319_A03G062700v1 [Gossypium barbadense]KAG4207199.1 hypothetical protein ERO13_A03G051600v2 [Gossypium hirsutum]TYH24165.1 hypothetical protein ES288_A03G069500v1 [Gossypium darwinii]TYI35350.1 hypothetical protein ES332_A03G070500v1 [Gossypium tomentosum]TYJ42132.1 hypothetical protein E1A91_A03G067200v1 [Gossypium mustelinum]